MAAPRSSAPQINTCISMQPSHRLPTQHAKPQRVDISSRGPSAPFQRVSPPVQGSRRRLRASSDERECELAHSFSRPHGSASTCGNRCQLSPEPSRSSATRSNAWELFVCCMHDDNSAGGQGLAPYSARRELDAPVSTIRFGQVPKCQENQDQYHCGRLALLRSMPLRALYHV